MFTWHGVSVVVICKDAVVVVWKECHSVIDDDIHAEASRLFHACGPNHLAANIAIVGSVKRVEPLSQVNDESELIFQSFEIQFFILWTDCAYDLENGNINVNDSINRKL